MTAEAQPWSVRAIEAGSRWMISRRRKLSGIGLGIVAVFLLSQSIYTVENGSSAALLRLGRVIDSAVPPGLHFHLPLGIDTVAARRTDEVVRLEILGDTAPSLVLLTGDENLIDAQLVVQYRILDLGRFLFGVEEPEEQIRNVVRTAFQHQISVSSVEDVLTSAKARLQVESRQNAQRRLDDLGVGVVLVSVNLSAVAPPAEAASAFRQVSDARAEAAEIVNRARAASEQSLRLARGSADQDRQQASAAASARRSEADGAARRFEQLLARRIVAPQQTRDTLKFDTFEKILSRAEVVLVPPGQARHIEINLLSRDGSEVPFEKPLGSSRGPERP